MSCRTRAEKRLRDHARNSLVIRGGIISRKDGRQEAVIETFSIDDHYSLSHVVKLYAKLVFDVRRGGAGVSLEYDALKVSMIPINDFISQMFSYDLIPSCRPVIIYDRGDHLKDTPTPISLHHPFVFTLLLAIKEAEKRMNLDFAIPPYEVFRQFEHRLSRLVGEFYKKSPYKPLPSSKRRKI